MLIKTEHFDKTFMDQLYYILINKNMFRIMGSYTIKPFGSMITDIDITQKAYINQSLLERIRQNLRRLSRSNFSFVYLQCGEYDDFVLPWTIDTVGDCNYSPEKVASWFTAFKAKQLVEAVVYTEIEKILTSPQLTIKDLFEIRKILRPYTLMLWSEKEIYRGYKEHNGKRYLLLDKLHAEKSIMKFLYRYGPEYCSIEMAIVDKEKQFNPFILHDYYRDNTYKVFKSYKWYLEKENKEIYEKANKVIDPLNALRSRIELLELIQEYRLVSQDNFRFLVNDCQLFARSLGFQYSMDRSKEILNELTILINNSVADYIKIFEPLVQPRFVKTLNIYNLRTKQSKVPLSQQELERRYNSGYKCPFFELKLDDLYYLYDLGQRLQFNPLQVIECYENIAHQYDIDLGMLINTTFPKNNLKIFIMENEIEVRVEGRIIKKFAKENLRESQLFVINYKE